MPPATWSDKRERQYRHVRQSVLDRGRPVDEAEEIAARTVNKARAQAGESDQASTTSLDDLSPSRRGGLRSHEGAGGRTYRQLYAEAKARGLEGRSKMSKAELKATLER